MPELAELRLTADFINENVRGKKFTQNIEKSVGHKQPDIEGPGTFTIDAESRGKELKLIMTGHTEQQTLMMGMGMTGGFVYTKTGDEPKYSHLKFFTTDGYTLSFVDKRKFGRWKFGDWKVDRSPDPTTEYDEFVKHIYTNINKTAFNKPIYELLMNQNYCNGIGNYLRAEILGRIDSNPFVPARDYIQDNPQVLELCHEIPLNSYEYKKSKGLNYDGNEPYLKYYKKDTSLHIEDKGKRVFWYDSKWGVQ
jgi:formamidopyrimidine-DNA glycosylase